MYYTAEKLKKPLSADEEKLLMEQLSKGSIEAKNELTERNLRLVIYVAQKFSNSGIETEELFSIGSVGLLKAANTFKPDKNIKFATYAATCITNQILMFIRSNKKFSHEVSLEEPLSTDVDGNKICIEDVVGYEDMAIENNENAELLYTAMKVLPEKQKEVINRLYLTGDKVTQRDVGKNMGFSQSYIARIEGKALKKLRNEFDRLCGPRKTTFNQTVNKKIIKESVKSMDMENQKVIETTETLKLTKKLVRQMAADGKTVEEIIDTFIPTWNGKPTMLRAKVQYFLSEKSDHKHRKINQPDESMTVTHQKVNEIISEQDIPKKSSLRPMVLRSRDINFEYSFYPEGVYIKTDTGKEFSIDFGMIDKFVKELQEVKSMAEIV